MIRNFERKVVTTAWPLPVTAAPERVNARFDIGGDGIDEMIGGVTVHMPNGGSGMGGVLLVRYASGNVERIVLTADRGSPGRIRFGCRPEGRMT